MWGFRSRRALVVNLTGQNSACAPPLGMRGFDVACAETSSFARALLSAHRPRVVVMEYPYELDDGFELLELLQECRGRGVVKVLAITGFRIPPELDEVVREQADLMLRRRVAAALITASCRPANQVRRDVPS
jgi:DNA-binding NarL/FixJ family response regulator